MKRRLFPILAFAGLVLVEATGVVWLSEQFALQTPHHPAERAFAVDAHRSGVSFLVARRGAARRLPHPFTNYDGSMFSSRAVAVTGTAKGTANGTRVQMDDVRWDGTTGRMSVNAVEIIEAEGAWAGVRWRRGLASSGPVETTDGTWALVPWWSVRVPYPLLIALFALPPLLWLPGHFRRRRARMRAAAGLCPDCGYDLRGSTDCCPECGRAVAPGAPWSNTGLANSPREPSALGH